MPADVYCYCSRYTRTWSESPWQGGPDRDLVTFNNLSQVSYAGHRLAAEITDEASAKLFTFLRANLRGKARTK